MELKRQQIAFKAVIAGDGEEREELKAMARGMDIEFAGYVSGEEKCRFLKKAKFFVFPSFPARGDVEGLPVALLEALYSGRMAVASRATNIELLPEWEEIRKGVILLEDPQEKEEFVNSLKKLLTLRAHEFQSITMEVRQTVEKYRWDRLIHQYIEHIIKCVGLKST